MKKIFKTVAGATALTMCVSTVFAGNYQCSINSEIKSAQSSSIRELDMEKDQEGNVHMSYVEDKKDRSYLTRIVIDKYRYEKKTSYPIDFLRSKTTVKMADAFDRSKFHIVDLVTIDSFVNGSEYSAFVLTRTNELARLSITGTQKLKDIQTLINGSKNYAFVGKKMGEVRRTTTMLDAGPILAANYASGDRLASHLGIPIYESTAINQAPALAPKETGMAVCRDPKVGMFSRYTGQVFCNTSAQFPQLDVDLFKLSSSQKGVGQQFTYDRSKSNIRLSYNQHSGELTYVFLRRECVYSTCTVTPKFETYRRSFIGYSGDNTIGEINNLFDSSGAKFKWINLSHRGRLFNSETAFNVDEYGAIQMLYPSGELFRYQARFNNNFLAAQLSKDKLIFRQVLGSNTPKYSQLYLKGLTDIKMYGQVAAPFRLEKRLGKTQVLQGIYITDRWDNEGYVYDLATVSNGYHEFTGQQDLISVDHKSVIVGSVLKDVRNGKHKIFASFCNQ